MGLLSDAKRWGYASFVGAAVLGMVGLATAPFAHAQDTASTSLQPVRVTVTRDAARSTLDIPFAIARVSIDSARTGVRRASFTEMLFAVPGLAISNRNNPTQDPRLSVRGFGARSAFGIRGVRVVRDGISLTLADGSTPIDFVDLETLGAAEVLRGASGALYGNASGGVLDLRTDLPPTQGYRARVRGVVNADAARWSAHAAGGQGALSWQGTFTQNRADGPRDYSRFRSTTATGDAVWRTRFGTLRAQALSYDSPEAENPGALTIDELSATPTRADSQNILRRATKLVDHKIVALAGDRSWTGGSARVSVSAGRRDLDNPQAFAIVGFSRRTLGAGARVQQSGVAGAQAWRLALGTDVQFMRDERRNFENCAGLTGPARPATRCPTASDLGALTLHQLEKVLAGGVYARGELTRSIVSATATVRGDRTNFSVRDRRVATVPGGPLEEVPMGAVTPMLGLVVRARPTLSLYTNYARSFETPTTTELATQPSGAAGLNRDLKPQRGRAVEVGVKGIVASRLAVDVALFDIATTDELIAFEVPNSGGRRYFRNAGETSRRGAELGVSASLGAIDLGGAFTRLIYEYEDYLVGTTRLDGRRVPGVSPATASLWTTTRRRPGWATVELTYAARTAADDANINYAPSYVIWNARAGLSRWSALGVVPVLGVDNLFDRTYAANVVTNATRGRFFEPGPGRRVYVSLEVGAASRR